MKKIIFLILIVPFLMFSQPRKEKLKSLRIAYITSELSLTEQETTKFLPIFSDFDENQSELKKKLRILLAKRQSIEDMSESEASELLNQSEKIEEDLFNNRKNLIKNLKGILSSKKLLKLRKVELEFNKKLIDKIKDRE